MTLLEKCWGSATMEWDHEVDLVSVGSGAGGLATAIVAADDGQTVFVAQSTDLEQRARHRFGVEVSDSETNTYFDAVTEVAATARPETMGSDLPLRLVAGAVPVTLGCTRRRHTVEPFVGARLGDWAADCVVASHGVLYSHVTDRNMTTMRSSGGEKFEAAVVGALGPDVSGGGWAIDDWLAAQARSRGISVHTNSCLERLVFDDGRVVGAVMMTPDGVCAVSARRGVVVATAGHGGGTVAAPIPADTSVQVCVVSKTASRFGRVELLARPRVAGRAVVPPGQNRQLRSHKLNSRACHRISPGQLRDGSL